MRRTWGDWLLPGAGLLLLASALAGFLTGCTPQPPAVPADIYHDPAAPGTSQEPGFTAFCAAHPGRGTCP
jgi:hypothetical protein